MLTKECDYGIRVIRSLADNRRKTVEAISTAEHIPHQYAYKILKKLEKAEFVKCTRGRDGGYRLAKSLDSFTIYDVIVAINKNLFLHKCLKEGQECPNNQISENNPCAVHVEFGRIQEIFVEEMKRKTMLEIIMPEGDV